MNTYCEIAPSHAFHGPYHDKEYGFPTHDDNRLFERLMLEINQAGLSWLTILKKRDSMRLAYAGFDIDAVAAFDESDRDRLLNNAGVIRNRLKVDAAIFNAQRVQKLRQSHGSFEGWLNAHHPMEREEWQRLFKKTFKFTGGEIVHEFLLSTGYLRGAHHPGCPIYARVLELQPPWSAG